MEIRVDVKGVSCHGSAPERGDNAIYKMADILQDVRALNENGDGPSNTVKGLVKMLNPAFNPQHYEDAQFLGRGTCTVRAGAEPWQLTPFTSTRISMRPRWPR